MDKVSFIGLWDVYRGLLTPTQQEITDMYFNLDLTLSEIADEKGITRQGVSECLKTCKKQLEEYEEKLHIVQRLREASLAASFMATDTHKWAEAFMHAHPEYTQDIAKLLSILDNDYSEETAEIRQAKNKYRRKEV